MPSKKIWNLEEQSIIKDLYYNQKKNMEEIAKQMKCCRSTIEVFFKQNHLPKRTLQENMFLIHEKTKQNLKRKYNITNISQLKEIQKKISITKKNKSKEEKQQILEKREQTCLKKFGTKNVFQNEQIKKIIQQKLNNKTEEEKQKIKQKTKQTVNNKTEEEKQKIKQKTEETNLKKYGHINPLGSKIIRQKITQILQQKYNVLNVSQIQEVKEKKKKTLQNKTEEEKQKILEKQIASYHKTIDNKSNNLLYHSKGEEEIYNFLLSIGILKEEIERNRHCIIKNNEIDLYIPKYNLAIEYNGFRFHSSTPNKYNYPVKSVNYHFNKYLKCKEKKIRLISIWDIDWNYDLIKQQKIKQLLQSILNKNNLSKIYARKCIIKEIDNQIYKDFCNKYHLQNYRSAKIKLGLFYNNELIQIMSFSNVFNNGKKNNNIEYEMIRNCIKNNYIVVGGTEKLFKYFVTKYNPFSILSYSDNNFFTGDSYYRLGFDFIKETGPGMFWVHRNKKQKLYRNPFKNKEYVELEKQGILLKCYNCGSKKFIWRKS